jgi:hypothetical protein
MKDKIISQDKGIKEEKRDSKEIEKNSCIDRLNGSRESLKENRR